jgi:hypothetical protein
MRVSDVGDEMPSRENIPLAVMNVVSAAILLVFAFSAKAMLEAPRQHDGCGWSQNASIAPAWRAETIPKTSWNPAFPPSPPSRPLARVGCTKSSISADGAPGRGGHAPVHASSAADVA